MKTEIKPETETEVKLVNLRTALLRVEGISPLAWTRMVEAKRPDEDGRVYEERVWQAKVHAVAGRVAVPAMALRDSIAAGGREVPLGRKGAMAAGVIRRAVRPITTSGYFLTDQKLEDLRKDWRMMPSNPSGKKAGVGARVPKLIPLLDAGWTLEASLAVFDDRLTDEVISTSIARGGIYEGIGALRVGNGGILGSYKLLELEWE